jgi:hypothetical protein
MEEISKNAIRSIMKLTELIALTNCGKYSETNEKNVTASEKKERKKSDEI